MKRKQKGLKGKESNWSNDQDSCLTREQFNDY